MKKIYYKVSSFFTEKRSTIILLLMVLSILFIPKNTYALSGSGYNQVATWSAEFTSKLNNYYNYDNLIYFTPSTSINDSSQIYFIPLKNSDSVCVNNNGFIVKNDENWFYYKYILFTELDNFSFINKNLRSTTSTGVSVNSSRTHSSINLYKCSDNSLWKTADFSYTPPSSDCPTCEVCEECQECEEGGPVEVSNFPFDKTDFYTLLVLIGILIIMLFLKWCFPMKGGKNNK